MSGNKKYGNNMLKKASVVCLAVFLSSCAVLPGLQNPNRYRIPKQPRLQYNALNVRPTLIQITTDYVRSQPNAMYVYHVAPADVLNVAVWAHPEFTPVELHAAGATTGPSVQGAAGQMGYLVNPEGYIFFPLVGNVHVSGDTVDDIRVALTRKLKKYIRNPQINVRVADFRGQKIYVFGEVGRPGFIPLNDQPLTITDALTMSGSLDPNAADPGHIYIIRGNLEHPYIYWLNARQPDGLLLAEHFNLQPGDVLYVSSSVATQWNRVINQLLPTIQAVFYTQSTVNQMN